MASPFTTLTALMADALRKELEIVMFSESRMVTAQSSAAITAWTEQLSEDPIRMPYLALVKVQLAMSTF